MAKQKDLSQISYGLETPEDLMGKLLHDAKKIHGLPHRYDLFNFFVTAAVLYEWCRKYYQEHAISQQLTEAIAHSVYDALPLDTCSWIKDQSCVPNSGQDARRHMGL